MLTKATNQSNQKIVNKMTYKVYTHRHTHVYIYTYALFHITLKVNVCSVLTSKCSNTTNCDKFWLFWVIFGWFWMVVGGCGWLWLIVPGCGCLWLVVGGCGWLHTLV